MAQSSGSAAKGLSEKMSKFGILGGAVIPDSLTLLKEMPQPEKSMKSIEEMKSLMNEQVTYQDETSVVLGNLAHEYAQEKSKKSNLSFQDAHKKILEQNFPKEPFELNNMSEQEVQEHIELYAEDMEIQELAMNLIPKPPPTGRPPKNLSSHQVLEIHEFMAEKLNAIIKDVSSLSKDFRHKLTGRAIEVTAELIVSIAVEKKYDVRSDDVETSLMNHQDSLQMDERFQQASHILQQMMQALLAMGKPKVNKDKFETMLNEIAAQGVAGKQFVKALHDEYEAGGLNMVDAYNRFEKFADSAQTSMQTSPLQPVELKACYDAYKNFPEIQDAWERSGQDTQVLLGQVLTGQKSPMDLPPPSKKIKALKVQDIIEMQELMVQDLKNIVEEIGKAVDSGANGVDKLRDDLAMPLIQGIASAGIEKKYGINSEEMTLAGFYNAATLSINEKFINASMQQQQILSQVPAVCRDGGKGCSIM